MSRKKDKDVLTLLFFCAVWTVPMAVTGLINRDIPALPATMQYLYNPATMFNYSVDGWPVYYVQYQDLFSGQWRTINENDFFRLKARGHATRLTRILHPGFKHYSKRDQAAVTERQFDLMEWFARKYQIVYPDRPPVTRVRIINAKMLFVDRKLVRGHWQKPPVGFIADDQINILNDARIYE